MMAIHNPDADLLAKLTEIDRTIHEPSRLLILATLNVIEKADFLFLKSQTGLTKGNLSSHLAKLEKVKYVVIKKEFVDKIPRTLISITKEGKKALKEYRIYMQKMLKSIEK